MNEGIMEELTFDTLLCPRETYAIELLQNKGRESKEEEERNGKNGSDY